MRTCKVRKHAGPTWVSLEGHPEGPGAILGPSQIGQSRAGAKGPVRGEQKKGGKGEERGVVTRRNPSPNHCHFPEP